MYDKGEIVDASRFLREFRKSFRPSEAPLEATWEERLARAITWITAEDGQIATIRLRKGGEKMDESVKKVLTGIAISEADIPKYDAQCAEMGDTVPVREYVILRDIVLRLCDRVYQLEHMHRDPIEAPAPMPAEEPNERG